MEVTLALLCDSAHIAADGRLSLRGQFSQIASPAFPCELPLMHLALRFEAWPSDAGAERELLIDGEGNRSVGLDVIPAVPFEEVANAR